MSSQKSQKMYEGVIHRDVDKLIKNIKETGPGQSLDADSIREIKSEIDKKLEAIIIERR